MENSNKPLAEKTAHLLADVVVLRSLAHGYHWNVLGVEFSQYHDFFEEIYTDIDESVDPLAESILKLGYDAPYLLSDFLELACVSDGRVSGEDGPETMVKSLHDMNAQVIDCYNHLLDLADEFNEQGLVDFVGGRIDMHKKWDWQLKASLGIR